MLLMQALFLLAAFSPLLQAEDELITAPFGLKWGLTPEDLKAILTQFKVKIISQGKGGAGFQMEVSGIPQKNLLRTIFHFEDNMLWEVELHLGDASWKTADYTRFFEQTKKILNQRYGNGLPIVLEKDQVSGINSVLGGYEWMQPGGSIRLYFFLARSPEKELHVLSQHYRAP